LNSRNQPQNDSQTKPPVLQALKPDWSIEQMTNKIALLSMQIFIYPNGGAMLFVIIWIGCAVACNRIAQSKGFNTGAWTILGLVFGLFAIIAALVLPAKSRTAKGSYSAPQQSFPTPKFTEPDNGKQNGFPQPRFDENQD
jgi:hypothetical protein